MEDFESDRPIVLGVGGVEDDSGMAGTDDQVDGVVRQRLPHERIELPRRTRSGRRLGTRRLGQGDVEGQVADLEAQFGVADLDGVARLDPVPLHLLPVDERAAGPAVADYGNDVAFEHDLAVVAGHARIRQRVLGLGAAAEHQVRANVQRERAPLVRTGDDGKLQTHAPSISRILPGGCGSEPQGRWRKTERLRSPFSLRSVAIENQESQGSGVNHLDEARRLTGWRAVSSTIYSFGVLNVPLLCVTRLHVRRPLPSRALSPTITPDTIPPRSS